MHLITHLRLHKIYLFIFFSIIKVSSLHKQYVGLGKKQAMMEYIKIVQNLKMFGVTYFPIVNKEGIEMYLGVHALGVNTYDLGERLSPIINFPWSEIKKISHTKNEVKVI